MRRILFLIAVVFSQPVAADDWSGAYFGAFGGAGTSNGRAVLQDYSGVIIPNDVEYGLFPRSIEGSSTGAVVGVGGGYNFQSKSFVSGIEVDIGHAGTSPHHSYSRIDNVPSSPFPGVSTNTNYSTDFGVLATLRLRAGYAYRDTLFFGSAGLAAGRVHNRFELSLPEIGYSSPDWSGSGMRLGYAIGLGIEHRFTRSVSLKFETMYVNLADRTVNGIDSTSFAGEAISYKFSNDMIVSRVGINVKF